MEKPKEPNSENKERVLKTIKLLEKEYSDATITLNYSNPLELLVATILSAQCTDQRVNVVTKTLFKRYKKAEDYANANISELEQDIRSTGFFRNKSKNIKKCCQMLIEKFDSRIPDTMEEILELPGVARKTANIVLSKAFGVVEGIAVDTHVGRLAKKLGLTEKSNPDKIEKDLMKLTPKASWVRLTDLLISHGRKVCRARKPKCELCVLNRLCPSAFQFG